MQYWGLACCFRDGNENGGGFVPNERAVAADLVRYGAINIKDLLTLGYGPELTSSFRNTLRGNNTDDQCGHVIPRRFFGSASNANNFILQNGSINSSLGNTTEEKLYKLVASRQYSKLNPKLESIWIYKSHELYSNQMAIRPSAVLHLIQFNTDKHKFTYGHYFFNPTSEQIRIVNTVLGQVSSTISKAQLFQYPIKTMSRNLQGVVNELKNKLNSEQMLEDTVEKVWQHLKDHDLDHLCGNDLTKWQESLIELLCVNLPIERSTNYSVAKLVFKSGYSIGHFLIYLYDLFLQPNIQARSYHLTRDMRTSFSTIKGNHFKSKSSAKSEKNETDLFQAIRAGALEPMEVERAPPDMNVASGAYQALLEGLSN